MQSLRLKRSWSFDTFACTFAVFCLMLSRAGYWSTVPLSDPVISSHETLEIGWLTSTPEPVFLGASRRDKSRGQRITSGSALTRKMTNDSKPSVEASGSRLPVAPHHITTLQTWPHQGRFRWIPSTRARRAPLLGIVGSVSVFEGPCS